MASVVLAHEVDWGGWRDAARRLVLAGVPPERVVWSVGAPDDLFAGAEDDPPPEAAPGAGFVVPRAFVMLAQTVIQAAEPERFALLYALLWRMHGGQRHLLDQVADLAVRRANQLAQSVRRDTHNMRAFLRFREVTEADRTRHVAWFEPAHFIVEANAPFFVRRFATMAWSILTPYRSAHWDGAVLTFGPGADIGQVPDDDRLADYWRVYFASIFNPARLKVHAMTAEMPRKYWRNLPEAAIIPELIETAAARAEAMVQTPMLSPPRPTGRSTPSRPDDPPAAAGKLADLAAEAAACRRCPLWQHATQTVFGEGPLGARLMLVGEQPGDHEDLAGRPFVGPAGQLLDRALAEAGIDRTWVYITNAVKHFKYEPRGRRRIHQNPDAGEIAACRWWLDQERARVRPALTVLLGASAARAVIGRPVAVMRERGRLLPLPDGDALVTVHPSYLLRVPDPVAQAREYAGFVGDLRQAAQWVADWVAPPP